ncbi:hypothetical protein COLO4_29871 [Corchorus olitorius]|uniref:Uncharacterized protein n=1 Tax=Corchorus olitorius TaxID=93759 RepID=A0A1R3HCW6_9ROSI|nr:hypothetical protein COLO4_29871 [Corchorus olitorius]
MVKVTIKQKGNRPKAFWALFTYSGPIRKHKNEIKREKKSDLPDSNQRPKDSQGWNPLQSSALPTELRSDKAVAAGIRAQVSTATTWNSYH